MVIRNSSPDGATDLAEVIAHQIARRVRQVRTARGMTLGELASVTALSPGLLSKIENCNVSPPIGTLSRLARGLGVSIGEFFDTGDPDPGRVYFPKGTRQIVSGRRTSLNYEYELLISARKKRDMQPMIVSIDGRSYKFGLQEHPGEQFMLMLEGSMDYIVGDKRYSVLPDDCLYFNARLPHGPKLNKAQRARYLVVHTGT
jgi:transcriptional regulator with XRE-family HTH domain